MLKDSLPRIRTELPGPKSKKIIDKRLSETANAVSCGTPAAIERAEGCMIQDVDGNIFLDFVAGIGVMNVGHSNPKIVKAAQDQLVLYTHPQANCIHYKELGDLAEKINKIVPGNFKKKTFYCNTGAEAVENAVKISRKFTGKKGVIAFTNAYHGRTIFTMAMNATVKPYGKGFMMNTDGIHRAEFPDTYRLPKGISEKEAVKYYIEKLKTMLKTYVDPDEVGCIILEPVQGEGGFTVFPVEYVKELRKICDENNILLIADEIQSGWCRTGKMLACEYWAENDIYPDIVTTAKSVAAGLPLAMVTAREEILESCKAGELGGTYGGNPVSIASAMAALDVMEEEKLSERALEINKISIKRLEKMAEKFEIIGNIRGLGAMIGIEFIKDSEKKEHNKEAVDFITKECVENGLLLKSAGYMGNTIRLLMPLVISDKQLNVGFDIIEEAIKKYLKK